MDQINVGRIVQLSTKESLPDIYVDRTDGVVRFPSGAPVPVPKSSNISTEQHFTPKEIAELWGFDEDTVRDMFRNEPGVLRLERRATRGKRAYTTLRVPASVVARVHKRMEAVAA